MDQRGLDWAQTPRENRGKSPCIADLDIHYGNERTGREIVCQVGRREISKSADDGVGLGEPELFQGLKCVELLWPVQCFLEMPGRHTTPGLEQTRGMC